MIPSNTIRPESPADDIMARNFNKSLYHMPSPIITEGYRQSPVRTILVPVKTAGVPVGVHGSYEGDVSISDIYR